MHADVSRRTVRYYVQIKLLDPPLGRGRGHYYTERHLERLRLIKAYQAEGYSLGRIAAALQGRGGDEPTKNVMRRGAGGRERPDSITKWCRIELRPGLEIHVESGGQPLSEATLSALRSAVEKVLDGPEPKKITEDGK